MRRTWLVALLVAAPACGGSVASSDGGSEAGADSGGCPQPPSAPVYGCELGAPDAAGCGPWGSDAAGPVYPVGCVVTTPMEGTYCGPVTCNCSTEFADSGASWICPL